MSNPSSQLSTNTTEGEQFIDSDHETDHETDHESVEEQHASKSSQCDLNTDVYNEMCCRGQEEKEYLDLFSTSTLSKNIESPLFQKIRGYCSSIAGVYYCVFHLAFMLLTGIIIYFVTNKVHLCMLLLVISIDAYANVIFFDCPLSSLEKKYLKTSMIESRLHALRKYGMMYSNNKYYDTQLEVIINGWTLCASKILLLIVFDWFKIPY